MARVAWYGDQNGKVKKACPWKYFARCLAIDTTINSIYLCCGVAQKRERAVLGRLLCTRVHTGTLSYELRSAPREEKLNPAIYVLIVLKQPIMCKISRVWLLELIFLSWIKLPNLKEFVTYVVINWFLLVFFEFSSLQIETNF